MSNSPTITDRDGIGDPADWLHNPHAGEMLSSEFMEPLGISATELANAVDVAPVTVAKTIAGDRRMDADLDLRLARYFQMPAGFFLGLQIDYELLEARRALNGALDRIVPRAA